MMQVPRKERTVEEIRNYTNAIAEEYNKWYKLNGCPPYENWQDIEFLLNSLDQLLLERENYDVNKTHPRQ